MHRKKLSEILSKMKNFWPVDKFSQEQDVALRKMVKYVTYILISYRWLGVFTTILFIPMQPFLVGKRILPMVLWEPVNMEPRPLYEFAYIFECIASYFTCCTNVAVDSLFIAIAVSLICQFRLLGAAFRSIKFKQPEEEKTENQFNKLIKKERREEDQFEKIKKYTKYHNFLYE